MGKSQFSSEKMIDLSAKPQMGEGGERHMRKAKSQSLKKHDAINLPKNVVDSGSEDDVGEFSSEDENHQFTQDQFCFKTNGHDLGTRELSSTLGNLVLNKRKPSINEALPKLRCLVKEVQQSVQNQSKICFRDKDLKPRSPFRNKVDEHKKNKLYDPAAKRNAVTPLPLDHQLDLQGAVKEVMAALRDHEYLKSLQKLSDDEAEEMFAKFISEQEQPHTIYTQSSASGSSPTQRLMTPVMSPLNTDLYDSSYETGSSPSSTVVASPGSPATWFSPPRTSVSSESDQELDSATENLTIQQQHKPWANTVYMPATPRLSSAATARRKGPEPEPTMKPLGEVVPFIQTSATERLEELHSSTNFCKQHFSIQLVRVIMSAKGQAASDKVDGFCKSILSTMKIKLGNRAHEGDIWQMSILAHMQFLLARALEYQPAFKRRDERGHSLLYIAAVEQYKKPLIARYIAESMLKVGHNPLDQVDEKGNTVLHILAELGDSHVHVLSEILMSCGSESAVTFNKTKQTPLHIAMQSVNPHLSTALVLLKMGANPFQQDTLGMTALHYHSKQMARQFPRSMESVELIRKMMQAPVSLTKESLQSIELLRSDSSVPPDLSRIILDELNKYCVKDLRSKKNERR